MEIDLKEVLTITNIATIIAFATIAIFLQWLFQKLINMIFQSLNEAEEKEGKEIIEKKKGKRIKRILKFVAFLFNAGLFLYVAYTIIFTTEKSLPGWFLLAVGKYGRIILLAVAIYLFYKIAVKLTGKLIHTLLHKTAFTEGAEHRAGLREQTLIQIISYLLIVLLTVFFIYELLSEIGLDLKAILATAGFAGLGFGFAAQNLIRDYINGFFIILEDLFAVGDVISVNDNGGFVERLTLRTTHLRNTHGTLITIPNSEINTVKNLTKDWSRVDFTIGVDYATDVKKALNMMLEELEALKKEMPDDIIDAPGQKPDVLALDSFGNSSLNLRIWFRTKPIRQWAVNRAYNERLLERFNKEGIVIPFPQSTISMRDETNAQLRQLSNSSAGNSK